MGVLFRKKRDLPEYFFKRGEECLKNGNLRWALDSLNKAIELNSEHETAYLRRAETLRRLGREREAVWDLVKFIEYDKRGPDNPGDLDDVIREAFKIARMDMQRKGVKDEIVDFGIPRLLDEMMEGYDTRAKYVNERFYKLALSWLRNHPEQDGLYEGFIRLIKGDLNGSINKLKKAIEEDPEEPRPYYFTGIALLKKSGRGKNTRLRRLEVTDEVSGRVRSLFGSALSRGLKGRICPSCGYREFSAANFCLRCGNELLSAQR